MVRESRFRGHAARRALPYLVLGLAVVLSGCREEITWHRNGVRHASGPVALDRLRTGTWRFWYPSGQLREEGRYADGHRVGVWTQWHPGGQKASAGQRVWDPERGASLREGPWTFWWPNGNVRARGRFERGLRTGPWEVRIDTGRLDPERSGVYAAGERLDPGPGSDR